MVQDLQHIHKPLVNRKWIVITGPLKVKALDFRQAPIQDRIREEIETLDQETYPTMASRSLAEDLGVILLFRRM